MYKDKDKDKDKDKYKYKYNKLLQKLSGGGNHLEEDIRYTGLNILNYPEDTDLKKIFKKILQTKDYYYEDFSVKREKYDNGQYVRNPNDPFQTNIEELLQTARGEPKFLISSELINDKRKYFLNYKDANKIYSYQLYFVDKQIHMTYHADILINKLMDIQPRTPEILNIIFNLLDKSIKEKEKQILQLTELTGTQKVQEISKILQLQISEKDKKKLIDNLGSLEQKVSKLEKTLEHLPIKISELKGILDKPNVSELEENIIGTKLKFLYNKLKLLPNKIETNKKILTDPDRKDRLKEQLRILLNTREDIFKSAMVQEGSGGSQELADLFYVDIQLKLIKNEPLRKSKLKVLFPEQELKRLLPINILNEIGLHVTEIEKDALIESRRKKY